MVTSMLTLSQLELLSPQSRGNVIFAENPSLVSAINHYNPVSPPVYPTLMWILSRASLPLIAVNLIAFAGTLLWLWYAPSWIPKWKRLILIALYSLRPCVVANLHQYVAESLLILLALVSLSILIRYIEAPKIKTLVLLSAMTGIACMTRYFAIFWLVPIAASVILWKHRNSFRSLALHSILFAFIVFAICLPWMLHAKSVSGFWFGMSRTATRNFPPQYAYFSDTITPSANLLLMLRTLTIDLLSPTRFASHDLAAFGAFIPAEIILAAFAIIVLLASRLPASTPTGTKLSALMAGWFLIATFVIWSSGNNDPIYTRFLYPAYVFIGISACSLQFRLSVHTCHNYLQSIGRRSGGRAVGRAEADVS